MGSSLVTLTTTTPSSPLLLTLRAEPEEAEILPSNSLQPLVKRFRDLYARHMHREDELSMEIQDTIFRIIQVDYSNIDQEDEVLRIAKSCKKQFAFLKSDFDNSPLTAPIAIRGWNFNEHQLLNYISWDQTFGRRAIAISPFDNLPFPEHFERHALAEDLIHLLNTIPDSLVACSDEMAPAMVRYVLYKRTAQDLARARKMDKASEEFDEYLEALKLANTQHTREFLEQQIQELKSSFAEDQKSIQAEIDKGKENLKELEKAKQKLSNLVKKLEATEERLKVQEKKAVDLQTQINVEREQNRQLAMQVQAIGQKRKKRRWYKL